MAYFSASGLSAKTSATESLIWLPPADSPDYEVLKKASDVLLNRELLWNNAITQSLEKVVSIIRLDEQLNAVSKIANSREATPHSAHPSRPLTPLGGAAQVSNDLQSAPFGFKREASTGPGIQINVQFPLERPTYVAVN